MRLEIIKDFTLEVGNDSYKGTFKDLTKKQEKEVSKKFEKAKKQTGSLEKLFKEIKRVEKRLAREEETGNFQKIDELEVKIEKLEAEAEKLNTSLEADDLIESMFEERLNLSVGGEDKEAILKVAEEYGYYRVFQTIIEDIRERDEKN